jgi:hypothetical protein
MPWPSSPTRIAILPAYSTSLEAFDLFPALPFRRCTKKLLKLPSGSVRGRKKQVTPPFTLPSVKKPSDCGTEQNHLCPVSSY